MHQELVSFNVDRKSTSNFGTQTDVLCKNKKLGDMQILDSIKTYHSEKSSQTDNSIFKQINIKSEHNEIVELRKKVSNLSVDQNKLKNIEKENEKLKQQLIEQEMILFDVKEKKSISDVCIQTDLISTNLSSTHVQTLESMKTLQEIFEENEKLKKSIVDYETEIVNLKAKLQGNQKQYVTIDTQTEQPPTDVEPASLDDILKEMGSPIPNMLSPLSPTICENVDVDQTVRSLGVDIRSLDVAATVSNIPDVVVTPPTPTIEDILDFQNDQTSNSQPKHDDASQQKATAPVKDNLGNSRKSNNKTIYFKKVPKRRKYRSPYISHPFILNKYMFRREIRKARRHKNQDCILKALQTLKRAKINFTISNEPTSPKCCPNNTWLNDFPLTYTNMNSRQANTVESKTSISPPKYNSTKYLTEKLDCKYNSCKKGNKYMLLNKQNNVIELLGFYSIKNENITPSCSRVGENLDNKSSSSTNSIKPTGNTGRVDLTSEGLLQTLADLVSMKLKEMENLTKDRPTISDNNFDSLNSETETEIERLFEKKNVLRRNKILMKRAQHQKRCQSMSTSSLDQEIDSREVTSNTSTETVSNSPYTTEDVINTEMNRSPTVYAPDILPNIITNQNGCNINETQFCGETEDSCDSVKFTICPDLISPLSSISKGFKTPPSKMKQTLIHSNEQLDKTFVRKADILPDGFLKDTICSPQTQANLKKENIAFQPIHCRKECLKDLSTSDLCIIPFNSTEISNYLNDSVGSINLLNETSMCGELSTLLNNFESSNENHGEIANTQIERNEDVATSNVLYLTSLLSVDQSPTHLLNKFSNAFSGSVCPEPSNEDKSKNELQTQNIKYNRIKKSKVAKSILFPSINVSKEKEAGNNIENNSTGHQASTLNNLSPKELPPKKQSISLSLEDDEKPEAGCSLQNDGENSILNCPQSPLQEELCHIDPIIIPLEKCNNQETTECFGPANENNTLSSQQKNQTKISSPFSIEVQKNDGGNLNKNLDKSISKSTVLSTNEEKLWLEKVKLHHISDSPLSDNITEGEGMPRCKSVVYDNTENVIINSTPEKFDISVDEHKNQTNSDMIKESNNKSVDLPIKGEITKIVDLTPLSRMEGIKDKPRKCTTSDIFEALSNEKNEMENIPSCPGSPICDYSDNLNFSIPKIIPLENLRNESTTNLSISFDSPNSNEIELNEQCRLSDNENRLDEKLAVNETDRHINEETAVQLTKRNLSPKAVLRRSKRNLKRNKNYLELPCGQNCCEEDACTMKLEDVGIKNEFSSSDPSNLSSDIVIPTKKKRGRPRKEATAQKNLLLDQNCAEEDMKSSITPVDVTDELNNSQLSKNDLQKCPLTINNNNETVCQDSSTSGLIKTNLDEVSDANKKKETVPNRAKKRKTMTKLKSNVIRQFKEKRKMFQTQAEIVNSVNNSSACDLKTNNLSQSNIDTKQTNVCVDSNKKLLSVKEESTLKNCDTKEKCNKKIYIVQNILIPPNSDYAFDLLEKKEFANNEFTSNCDISLDLCNSSQKHINPDNNLKNKMTVNTNDIPIKKKKVHHKEDTTGNQEADILSRIMEEMDKDKPKMLPNSESRISKLKEDIPTSINDKEWRKSILEIAEITYNSSTDEKYAIGMVSNIQNLVKTFKDAPSKKVRILVTRLIKLSSDETIPDEIILEFKRQTVDNIAEIILQNVSNDTVDKAEDKYYPAPLMTKTQRILLSLMVRLESENVENLMDTFLTKAEVFLFKVGCGIRTIVPITRLYMAVCRLRADVNRMRMFCCNAFLFMGDLAIPLLFTVLTSWIEILPTEPNLKYYPITKALVQVVHLKGCNKPGYNLLPLRALLNQFYGYPKERWNCDEIFEEFFQQYLRSPVPSTELAIRLLCKNKDTKWVYKKVNEFLKPLIYKIPAENVNFKAMAIILIGKICKQFKPGKDDSETYLNDLRRWLIGLTEGETVSDIVERSVNLCLSMLPRKRLKVKKSMKRKKEGVNIIVRKKMKNKPFRRLKQKKKQ